MIAKNKSTWKYIVSRSKLICLYCNTVLAGGKKAKKKYKLNRNENEKQLVEYKPKRKKQCNIFSSLCVNVRCSRFFDFS